MATTPQMIAAAGLGFKPGAYLTVSYLDNIVAHAGGGQANAVPLLGDMCRIVTVASAGDSVELPSLAQITANPAGPQTAAGSDILVINHGANPVAVYGAGSDTIDDQAFVLQMPGSVTLYVCTTSGQWYSNGIGTGYKGSFPTVSYANGLTAHAGGGQASGTVINACINRFTTVASANDSADLPGSGGGMQITVTNAGANSMNVFPAVGEQINALGANAAFALAAGKTASFSCAVAGQWHALLSS